MSFKDPIKNRAEVKKYREANKAKVYLSKKRYVEANKEKVNAFFRQYGRDNYKKKMFMAARARAKKKGLEFNITLEDIVIPSVCPYLGVPLLGANSRQNRNSPSLDRIDSQLGYIKGNVRVISWLANTMKNNASIKELLMFAKGILRLHEAEKGEKYE